MRGEFSREEEPLSGFNPYYTRRAAGVHGVSLYGSSPTCANCEPAGLTEYASALASVIANNTTVVTVDLDATQGRVVADFTVDGVASDALSVNLAGVERALGTAGLDMYLPPGTYEGVVEYDEAVIEQFDAVVIAGEATDLGSADFHAPVTGTLTATLLWNGLPVQDSWGGLRLEALDTGASANFSSDGIAGPLVHCPAATTKSP